MINGYHYVIGVLVTVMVLTGLFTFHNAILQENNIPVDAEFLEVQGTINQTLEDSQTVRGDMEEKAQGGSNVQDSTIDAPKSALESAIILLSFPKIIIASTSQMLNNLGIPVWIITGILTIIIFTTVFVVIAYLRGKDL